MKVRKLSAILALPKRFEDEALLYLSKGFDPDRDIQETVPDLSVSIAECIQTGVVPAAPAPDDYNNIEDVNSIGHYVEDNFEVLSKLREVGKSLSSMPTEVDPTKQSIE